jgi:hypothetical protein
MASWFAKGLAGGILGKVSYILVIVGGIVMVIAGIAGVIAMGIMAFSSLGYFFGGFIVQIILGIVAFYFAKRVHELLWAIVLTIIGFIGISLGNLGGWLVALGGIASLIAIFLKKGI